jgi:hypothetical protein
MRPAVLQKIVLLPLVSIATIATWRSNTLWRRLGPGGGGSDRGARLVCFTFRFHMVYFTGRFAIT